MKTYFLFQLAPPPLLTFFVDNSKSIGLRLFIFFYFSNQHMSLTLG